MVGTERKLSAELSVIVTRAVQAGLTQDEIDDHGPAAALFIDKDGYLMQRDDQSSEWVSTMPKRGEPHTDSISPRFGPTPIPTLQLHNHVIVLVQESVITPGHAQ